MTVKELIEELQSLDQNLEIVMQMYSTAIDYAVVAGVDKNAAYLKNGDQFVDVYGTAFAAKDYGLTDDQWHEIITNNRCVVLFPVIQNS